MTELDQPMTPPEAVSFERRVLGAALHDADALAEVLQSLRPEDFWFVPHQRVYLYLESNAGTGAATDATVLAFDLKQDPDYTHPADPFEVVASLEENSAPSAALKEYINRIRACSQARQVGEFSRELGIASMQTQGQEAQVEELLSRTDTWLRDMSEKMSTHPWLSMAELVEARDRDDDAGEVMPTGFIDLDRLTMGGLRKQQLVVIAARPAMGKTTAAMDVSRNLSVRRHTPGLFVSLEMSGKELLERLISAESSVSLTKIKGGDLNEREEQAVWEHQADVAGAPMFVLDMSGPSLGQLRSIITAAKRYLGIEYVVIDYVQLITNSGNKNQSREQEVSEISRSLKALGKALDILVIIVAQLNRGPEQRTDKRPSMSDLRESGQLEQDADIVALLMRPDYYDPTTERAGEADLMVEKHRNGPTGTITLAFQGHYSRFASLAPADVYPEA